jgi:SNF2 family DNA or RNA helicase
VVAAAAAAADEGTDECIICMDAFTRPTMLPCAHIFCFDCITTAVKAKRECPRCKQPCASGDLVDIDAVKEQARETASSDTSASQLDAIDTVVVGPVSNWAPGSKLSAALDLMKEFPIEEKILMFTQFASFAELIVQHLNQRDEGDFHALAFTGALTAKQRVAVLKNFESAPIEAPLRPRGLTDFVGAAIAAPGPTAMLPRHVVLVATVQTGGVGLNITCASRCIVMDPCWNPATEAQATNRCHRIGQTRPVFIYRMITEGTVELQIEKLANSKSAFADLCLARAHRVQRMGLDDIVKVFDAALDADEDSDEE